MTEIVNFVDEIKHEHTKVTEEEEGNEESKKGGSNGGSGEHSDNQSALALFDKLQAKEDQELDDSVSSVLSSNSFRSVSTRKAKLTELNQKAFA
jgi:hypothetical protein